MKIKKVFQGLITGSALVLLLAACGSSGASGSPQADNSDVRKVKVAYNQAGKPTSWMEEDGNPTGYDVEVMRLVEELLPQYDFEYIGTTNEDLLIGLEQGKFQAGLKNAFWTEERTAKFIYPKEFLGLSSIGLLLKKDNEHVKSLTDFASADFSLAPIAANNAQYTIVEEYNNKNPDNKVNLVAGDEFTVDIVQWVNEGRVDGGIAIESGFDKQVTAEDGPYHNLVNDVVYNEFDVIKTWPLFNKKEQAFADAYDKAIKQLKDDKKTSELSKKFYGRDLFEVLETVDR